MNATLRQTLAGDAEFIERVFFTTQRWIIERLFGWRGDEFERQRLHDAHNFANAQIIEVDGRDAGWLSVERRDACVEIDGIYLLPEYQQKGVGSKLISDVIKDASLQGLPVRLGVAKINPAQTLYERLGFHVVDESEFKVFMERPYLDSNDISLVGSEHFEIFADLWYRAQVARGGATSAENPMDTLALVRARAAIPDAWFAGRWLDGKLVAIAHGLQARESDGAGGPIPELMHLGMIAVEPEHWGHGLGRSMTEFGLAEAKRRGYHSVQLWTHLHNTRARRLYENLGFVASGRRKDDGLGNEIIHYTLNLKC